MLRVTLLPNTFYKIVIIRKKTNKNVGFYYNNWKAETFEFVYNLVIRHKSIAELVEASWKYQWRKVETTLWWYMRLRGLFGVYYKRNIKRRLLKHVVAGSRLAS